MIATGATSTAIITGGNAGLGEQCARTIAADRSWHVVIASRDAERAQAAVARLVAETANPAIEALPLDLASLASVRAFAAGYGERARRSAPSSATPASRSPVASVAMVRLAAEETPLPLQERVLV